MKFSDHCLRNIVLLLLTLFMAVTTYAGTSSIPSSSLVAATSKLRDSSGVHILEYGEESLITRAWLTDNSQKTIDVQYFIWSTDNIGILAAEALLNAAERGIRVRVIVDDLLIDAEDKTMLALNEHPNVDIKIYNPTYNLGNTLLDRLINLVWDFRGTNQRMHDKVAIFDGAVGITGGRNMADEYYDFDHTYNFRDRDVLVIGKSVEDMSKNFNEFWNSDLSVPVREIFEDADVTKEEITSHYDTLHAYASNPKNFAPELRSGINDYGEHFDNILKSLSHSEVEFLSDTPGKNSNTFFLDGGSEVADRLLSDVMSAKISILIQSPYLILSEDLIDSFKNLISQGVSIKISTNSLASTDNLYAFSGYQKQRTHLFDLGIQIFEYKPYPANRKELVKRHHRIEDNSPIFAMHAKSMVIDGEKSYIGTFNADPRSANLNTEVGIIVYSKVISRELTSSIEEDMAEENSWQVSTDFNPDQQAPLRKRVKSKLYGLLPLDSVL